MSDVSERWTISTCPECGVKLEWGDQWECHHRVLPHDGREVEVVSAEQLRALKDEVEGLRDELEDTRADWARMKGIVERRGKAVEALREVAGRDNGIDRATCRQLATDALRAMDVDPTTGGQ